MTGREPLAEFVDEELPACAALMAVTPLWGDHGYTTGRIVAELCHPSMRTWGLRDEHGVVGFVAVLEVGFGFEPMVLYLCVREDAQNQGVGSALLDHVEGAYGRLYLTVTATNRAKELYLRRGWVQVGELPDHEEVGVSELLLRWTPTLPTTGHGRSEAGRAGGPGSRT